MRPRIDENKIVSQLNDIVKRVSSELDRKDEARERIIKSSRDLIRCSGQAVNYILAGDMDRSIELLKSCREISEEIIMNSKNYSELLKHGIGLQAIVEYCEAEMLFKVINESSVECTYINEYPEAYILALCDLTGEIKRLVIYEMSKWNIDAARTYLNILTHIYNLLKTLDYPDSITPGLRHKIDVLRRHIEDLETLFTDIKTRKELIDIIRRLNVG